VDNISRTFLDPLRRASSPQCVCPAFRPLKAGKMSRATVTEGVQLQHIVTRLRLFGTEIVHQADRPLDDMAQLARSLIGTLQDDGCTLQVVTSKQIGRIHFCSFQNGLVETAVGIGASQG